MTLSRFIVIVARAFEGKTDKAGRPYILHCLRVMMQLNSTDDELNMIAVGHDLFEDTAVTARYLRENGTSERVINGIWALTKTGGEEYDEYTSRVKGNDDAILVKCSDLLDNSDLKRLKGTTEKDVARTIKYLKTYAELEPLARKIRAK